MSAYAAFDPDLERADAGIQGKPALIPYDPPVIFKQICNTYSQIIAGLHHQQEAEIFLICESFAAVRSGSAGSEV